MRGFNPEDRLVRNQEILSTELDQETILMGIDAGAYFGLAGTAQRVWEKLQSPIAYSTLVDELAEGYNITPEACAADLQGFLEALKREGLLHVG
jgi:Coenzyme PQQ synthesis protein D (PqqD)